MQVRSELLDNTNEEVEYKTERPGWKSEVMTSRKYEKWQAQGSFLFNCYYTRYNTEPMYQHMRMQGRIQDSKREGAHQSRAVKMQKLMIFMTYLINVCSNV